VSISPYVFGLIGLFLVLSKEYSMGVILLIGALLEVFFPNWAVAQGNAISAVRLAIAALFVGLIIHRFASL
jgi:hypothetical protein